MENRRNLFPDVTTVHSWKDLIDFVIVLNSARKVTQKSQNCKDTTVELLPYDVKVKFHQEEVVLDGEERKSPERRR